jgi:hypothetical protein
MLERGRKAQNPVNYLRQSWLRGRYPPKILFSVASVSHSQHLVASLYRWTSLPSASFRRASSAVNSSATSQIWESYSLTLASSFSKQLLSQLPTMSGSSKLIVDSALRAAAHLRSSKVPTEVAKSSAALFSAYGGAKHTLPDLPYDYNALERK